MKFNNLLKLLLTFLLLFSVNHLFAQQKLGDNLGNHQATQYLQLNGHQVLDASGISIGTATLTGSSVGIELANGKVLKLSSVSSTAEIAEPLNGMIVYRTSDHRFVVYQEGSWATMATSALDSAKILIGSASNTEVPQLVTGDISLTADGVVSILDNKITSAMILDGTISATDLADSIITVAKLKTTDANMIFGSSSPSGSVALVSRDELALPRYTEAERDAISSPSANLLILNTDLRRLELYDSALPGWIPIDSASDLDLPIVSTAVIKLSILPDSAFVGGSVIAEGSEPVTSRGIAWALTENPTVTDFSTVSGSGLGTFGTAMYGLSAGTTYYVRAYARNINGIVYGNEITVTTGPAILPVLAATAAVTATTSVSAMSGGQVLNNGGAEVTARGVTWGTGPDPVITGNLYTIDGSGTGSFTSDLTGLLPGTLYYVRAYATNSVGTSYGPPQVFTTPASGLPSVDQTAAVTRVSANTFSGGYISDDGGEIITGRGVAWSAGSIPTISDAHTDNGMGVGNFTSILAELDAETHYYVRAYATNSIGTAYGPLQEFTTPPAVLPTITSEPVTVTATKAVAGGTVSDEGSNPVTARGVVWGTSQMPTLANSKTIDGTGGGSFTSSITGLAATAVTYYARAYATSHVGTAFGPEVSFATIDLSLPTVVSTVDPVQNGSVAATGGTISADGGLAITARGVVWGTNIVPVLENSSATTDGTGTGSFTSTIGPLNGNLTYYVRAYATTEAGTAYAAVVKNFLSDGIPPVMGTLSVTGKTFTSISYQSDVTGDGGDAITRGLVWSLEPNPILGVATSTSVPAGNTIGQVATLVSGLTENTTYYARAWATNAYGTAYSNEIEIATSYTRTFNYTGNVQSFTIPRGITRLARVEVYGAQGGSTNGGKGGKYVVYDVPVTPGDVYYVFVGRSPIGRIGSWNGGGSADVDGDGWGGGGASDIRYGGITLGHRVVVAGGGGGAGTNESGGKGGDGGGTSGTAGFRNSGQSSTYVGQGATGSNGGAGAKLDLNSSNKFDFWASAGLLGQGGISAVQGRDQSGYGGGGGGGGYYGGGGGRSGGGGGGGSGVASSRFSGGTWTTGTNTGNGKIIIEY